MTIYYCIENQIDNSNIGKHHFVVQPDFNELYCKFCFLKKDEVNYRPMMKVSTGKFRSIDTIPEANMNEKQLYAVNLYNKTKGLVHQ